MDLLQWKNLVISILLKRWIRNKKFYPFDPLLLYPPPEILTAFPALVTTFCITFIIKGNAYNRRNTNLGPFPDIAFINEEPTGCINGETIDAVNEVAISFIIAPRTSPLFLFYVLLF